MTNEIFIREDDLKRLFDALCCSLDFGSGFLEQEDTEALRRTAVILGVDPLDATPPHHMELYPHPYDAYQGLSSTALERCRKCGRAPDWKAHASE